ncbi:hypothetical protein [Ascidiimonas sp. W6]|uniref:hypothetical protein n=1 Tax=Ascidiimonas meishanensis TaxID=3128903 RepID=UPI0030ED4252
MDIKHNEMVLVKLAYTEKIAKNYNETSRKISSILEELAQENLTHESIVDDFLDYANNILPKLNHKEQITINDFVQRIARLRITANKGVNSMVHLLNDQNQLTKISTEEFKALIEASK